MSMARTTPAQKPRGWARMTCMQSTSFMFRRTPPWAACARGGRRAAPRARRTWQEPSPMAYRFKPPKAGCKTPGPATAAKLDLYVTVHRGDLSRFFRRGEEPDSRGDALTQKRDNIPKLVAGLVFRLDRRCRPGSTCRRPGRSERNCRGPDLTLLCAALGFRIYLGPATSNASSASDDGCRHCLCR